MTESYSPIYGCYFQQNEDKECDEDMTRYEGMTVEIENEKNTTPMPLYQMDISASVDCTTGKKK
jgi:hypothetical protein